MIRSIIENDPDIRNGVSDPTAGIPWCTPTLEDTYIADSELSNSRTRPDIGNLEGSGVFTKIVGSKIKGSKVHHAEIEDSTITDSALACINIRKGSTINEVESECASDKDIDKRLYANVENCNLMDTLFEGGGYCSNSITLFQNNEGYENLPKAFVFLPSGKLVNSHIFMSGYVRRINLITEVEWIPAQVTDKEWIQYQYIDFDINKVDSLPDAFFEGMRIDMDDRPYIYTERQYRKFVRQYGKKSEIKKYSSWYTALKFEGLVENWGNSKTQIYLTDKYEMTSFPTEFFPEFPFQRQNLEMIGYKLTKIPGAVLEGSPLDKGESRIQCSPLVPPEHYPSSVESLSLVFDASYCDKI